MFDRGYERLAEANVLSEIRIIHDYVQFIFEPHILSFYAPLRVMSEGHSLQRNDAGYYDSICSLIGQGLTSVIRRENELVEFSFSRGTKVVLSLQGEVATGPEAAELSSPDGEIMIEGYDR